LKKGQTRASAAHLKYYDEEESRFKAGLFFGEDLTLGPFPERKDGIVGATLVVAQMG